MGAEIVVPLIIAGVGAAATVGTAVYSGEQQKKAQEEAQDAAYTQAEKLKHEEEARLAQEKADYDAAKVIEDKKIEEQLIYSKQAEQVQTLANLTAAKQVIKSTPTYSYMQMPPPTPPQGGFISRFNSFIQGLFT